MTVAGRAPGFSGLRSPHLSFSGARDPGSWMRTSNSISWRQACRAFRS